MVRLILQRYLLKELIRAFVLAFTCFELFMFLGISVQLVHKGLNIINLRPLIPYILLYACPYSLPAALLTATVVAYGRLCADNEIVAIRTGGIHLSTIIMPAIFVGVTLCAVTLYLNAEVLPKAFYWVQMLQERAVKQILSGHAHNMKRKIVLEPYHVYIGGVEGTTYKQLVVLEYADDYVTNVLVARKGKINVDETSNIVTLTLQDGEFFKPNYREPEDVPKSGSFEETSFEVPLELKISKTNRKFLSLPELFEHRREINRKLYGTEEIFKDPKQVRKSTLRKILSLDGKLDHVLEEQEVVISRIQDANESISRHAKKAETLKGQIKLSEKHVERAKTSVERIMQELKTKKEEQHLESIRLFDEDIEGIEDEDDDGTDKVALISEQITKEQQSIQESYSYISTLENLQAHEKAGVESAMLRLDTLHEEESELRKERAALVARLDNAKIQEQRHEASITIHKRLSPSLSCLVFVLIGIPLGIKTRCGNVLISIGISFLLVLVLYYPLVIAGWVLAGDLTIPVIPAMWGANIIVGVVGIIFFQQVFRK